MLIKAARRGGFALALVAKTHRRRRRTAAPDAGKAVGRPPRCCCLPAICQLLGALICAFCDTGG